MDFCPALKKHVERRELAFSRNEAGEIAIAEMAYDHRNLLLLCQNLIEAHSGNDEELVDKLFRDLRYRLGNP